MAKFKFVVETKSVKLTSLEVPARTEDEAKEVLQKQFDESPDIVDNSEYTSYQNIIYKVDQVMESTCYHSCISEHDLQFPENGLVVPNGWLKENPPYRLKMDKDGYVEVHW